MLYNIYTFFHIINFTIHIYRERGGMGSFGGKLNELLLHHVLRTNLTYMTIFKEKFLLTFI